MRSGEYAPTTQTLTKPAPKMHTPYLALTTWSTRQPKTWYLIFWMHYQDITRFLCMTEMLRRRLSSPSPPIIVIR